MICNPFQSTCRAWLAIFVCSLPLSSTLLAQNRFNLNDLDPGQLVLNLDATEKQRVEQDTLNITVEYTVQGRDQAALQDEVNQAVTRALSLLREAAGINYATGNYRVFIFEPESARRNDIENPVWRAQQQIQMDSLDGEALLAITGELQALGLHMSNMYYSLSGDRFEVIADTLMNAALHKLQARADEAAATLGKGRADLVEVTISGSQNAYGNPGFFAMDFRARSTAAMASAPAADPGEAEVTLTVSARALLSP